MNTVAASESNNAVHEEENTQHKIAVAHSQAKPEEGPGLAQADI